MLGQNRNYDLAPGIEHEIFWTEREIAMGARIEIHRTKTSDFPKASKSLYSSWNVLYVWQRTIQQYKEHLFKNKNHYYRNWIKLSNYLLLALCSITGFVKLTFVSCYNNCIEPIHVLLILWSESSSVILEVWRYELNVLKIYKIVFLAISLWDKTSVSVLYWSNHNMNWNILFFLKKMKNKNKEKL